jgi:hypothetical protein
VPSSCTLSSSVDEAHSASIVNGTYEEGIGKTTLTTFCNDRNGYSVYAIGDSLNSEGNNKLVSNINSNYDILSGTATSGDTSNWAMKLNSVTSFTDNNTLIKDGITITKIGKTITINNVTTTLYEDCYEIPRKYKIIKKQYDNGKLECYGQITNIYIAYGGYYK